MSWALVPPAPLLTIVTVNVPEPEAPLYAPVPPLMVPGKVATLAVERSGLVAVTLKLSNLLNENLRVS